MGNSIEDEPCEDYDYCDECGGYGDNYSWDEKSEELVCNCPSCPFNPERNNDDETD